MNLKLLKYNVMVRKIKFRGKDIDTGEWRYGYLSFFYTAGRNKNGFIFTDKAQIYSPEDGRCYDVLAETVGEFTSLCDKNGKEIYEGALVFDGVDDYGICTGLPILDDYTVICRREIISIKNSSAVASKRTYPDDVGNFGAFVFERVFANGRKSTYSFGSSNGISEFDSNEVVYQTKTSYNGTTITSGSDNDSDTLCLGANTYNITLERCQEFSNVAIYYFALYNKSLTPEEVEEEKVKLENYWEGGKNELA